MRLSLLLPLFAALAVAGCSSNPFKRGPAEGSPAASSGGIQTTGLGRAPAAQAPSMGSRPLSELGTAEAVAARQAQAGGYAAPGFAGAPAVQPPLRGEPASAHGQVGGLEKGAKVSVRAGAALRLRPNSGSDAIQSLVLDTLVSLENRIYNAEGYWWYVTAGAEDGWLAQSDLLIP